MLDGKSSLDSGVGVESFSAIIIGGGGGGNFA